MMGNFSGNNTHKRLYSMTLWKHWPKCNNAELASSTILLTVLSQEYAINIKNEIVNELAMMEC